MGRKRWDPESSTGSSENHLSSTCHILEDGQREREVCQDKNDMLIAMICVSNRISSRPQIDTHYGYKSPFKNLPSETQRAQLL